jgi:transposase
VPKAPCGYTAERLLSMHADIVKQLRVGQSVRNAAKITGKGASTVQRVKAAWLTLGNTVH